MQPFPEYYNPQRIGKLFYPDVAVIAGQAENAALPPADSDKIRTLLLVVDMQVDFCHQGGTLFVPGAANDIRRLIGFIFRNAGKITHITCSLDSHLPLQIFHPAWWIDDEGQHPEPFAIISEKNIENGKWKPVFQKEWSVQYVKRLQQDAKKKLTIWPYHVPIGGIGNALDPELWSAVFWHSVARKSQPTWWRKGSIPQTEHYSMLKPEIEIPGEPKGVLSSDFIKTLAEYDFIFLAGEAASHCVLETAEDLVEIFQDQPEQLKKVFVLEDCMSPVVHPEVDFSRITKEKFAEFKSRGLQMIRSTDPFPDHG